MSPSHGYRGACLAAALALGVCACSPLRRVGECKRVVSTVNGQLDAIEALTPDAGASPRRYERIAARYGELNDQLGSMELADAKLKAAVEDYRALVSSTAEQCRSIAKELRTDGTSRAARSQRKRQLKQVRTQARRTVATQEGVVHALNDACRAK
jgi:hypothetical protein